MENLHDKQPNVIEREELTSQSIPLNSIIKSWELEILTNANELADEISTHALIGYLNDVIIFGEDAVNSGLDPKLVLETISSLSTVLYRAGNIISLANHINQMKEDFHSLSKDQPSTSQ